MFQVWERLGGYMLRFGRGLTLKQSRKEAVALLYIIGRGAVCRAAVCCETVTEWPAGGTAAPHADRAPFPASRMTHMPWAPFPVHPRTPVTYSV